jgi:hypothetical protein
MLWLPIGCVEAVARHTRSTYIYMCFIWFYHKVDSPHKKHIYICASYGYTRRLTYTCVCQRIPTPLYTRWYRCIGLVVPGPSRIHVNAVQSIPELLSTRRCLCIGCGESMPTTLWLYHKVDHTRIRYGYTIRLTHNLMVIP